MKFLNNFILMLFKVAFICILLMFVNCGPHMHKSKVRDIKENIEDLSFPRGKNHYKDGNHNFDFDHESILGSHNTAEEFDNLPPEEAKKRLRSLTLKMDLNGDKFIDRKELVEWVLGSFKMLTEEEALDMLEDEDGDEDGKVTWEEHLAETYGMFNEDIVLHDKDTSEDLQMLQNDKELFRAADTNQDGFLDKTEYSAFSHPEEFEHMHEVVYKQAMDKRDVNKDGFLSFDEFIADHHGSAPATNTEHYAMEKDRFYHDYDLNKDNRLSKEEVLLWLIPNNVETAENEADHLIQNSDTNEDGKLSVEEIVDHHDVFVGSEATDFGEHLHNSHRYEDEL